MEHLPVALHAVKLGAQHYEIVREPAQKRIQRIRAPRQRPDPDLHDPQIMEDKGYILRRRSEVQPDEVIVEVVRHRGEALPRRPRNSRRTSSFENTRDAGRSRYRRDTGGYASESEGSIPPRGRRTKSTGPRSRRARSSRSSSTSSSSQLGSTSGEEREMKKTRRKKWVTAGLASVATIHAASKVYSSIESHDKRVIAVQQGTLSPEDAHKQARSARWQDAAAIGIAALGIKGAISEWKEMAEEHSKHKELCEKHEEQHKRRIEHLRRKRAKEMGGYYKGRDGNWYYDGPDPQYSDPSRSSQSSAPSKKPYDQLAGPRQNDRKMIEAPPERSRSVYGRERSKSRPRSADNRDDSPSPVRARSQKRHNFNPTSNPLVLSVLAAPVLGYGAYKMTKADLADEPILKMTPEREEYFSKYKDDQHGEFKDFGVDALEEVLEKVVG